jgi:RNA-dependent RNA polymerase
MKSDLLGYISILHLRIADRNGPGCGDCLKLAELASQAVDFPKTGASVEFRSVPRISERCRPDFLWPEGSSPDPAKFYVSRKVLGTLFRNVPMENRRQPDEGRVISPTD